VPLAARKIRASGDEECLGYVDVEEQGVPDAVVVVEKVV
jgi:hypothetical protein